ncbi:hypothetical protein OPKNFCMD_6292 [Methylobacterium crusticola]|uniref:SDR family NAD(P)-dependent oxidoreductase n=1 Tax=Methylobacterium crusticola TaxID=1697972 RepID=A0ABQ4R871_9HYPH|nr:SDR family NAD(P)-dependent oxidoreductase [Methylobacterium crusticola]GJD53516.1 hypothetical protein OPKNFCMD_6292 [Methylobacterium crusticola]
MEALQQAIASRPNLHAMTFAADSTTGVADFARRVTGAHPSLAALVNDAGIMRFAVLDRARDLADAEATITTNLPGPIRLTDALIEHLIRQPDAALVNVTSGPAFVPLVATPPYPATKAAMHGCTSRGAETQARGDRAGVLRLMIIAEAWAPAQPRVRAGRSV